MYTIVIVIMIVDIVAVFVHGAKRWARAEFDYYTSWMYSIVVEVCCIITSDFSPNTNVIKLLSHDELFFQKNLLPCILLICTKFFFHFVLLLFLFAYFLRFVATANEIQSGRECTLHTIYVFFHTLFSPHLIAYYNLPQV